MTTLPTIISLPFNGGVPFLPLPTSASSTGTAISLHVNNTVTGETDNVTFTVKNNNVGTLTVTFFEQATTANLFPIVIPSGEERSLTMRLNQGNDLRVFCGDSFSLGDLVITGRIDRATNPLVVPDGKPRLLPYEFVFTASPGNNVTQFAIAPRAMTLVSCRVMVTSAATFAGTIELLVDNDTEGNNCLDGGFFDMTTVSSIFEGTNVPVSSTPDDLQFSDLDLLFVTLDSQDEQNDIGTVHVSLEFEAF